MFIQRVTTGIRAVREDRGLTQDRLAEKMGINTRSYQKMEKRTANLTLESIVKIANGLEMTPEELLLAVLTASRTAYPQSAAPIHATLHDSATRPAKPKRTRRDP